MPPTVSFPEPGTFLRYWDINAKRTKFLELADKRAPLVYIRRLGSIAAGGTGSKISLPDLAPDRRLNHRYMAYIGVRPGALYRIFHPYDYEQLNWDEKPDDINDDLTRVITYKTSPYDAPAFSLWIEPGRYPAIQPINVMERSSVPEILIIAAKYRVREESAPEPENNIDPATLDLLQTGRLPTTPVYFGGDV